MTSFRFRGPVGLLLLAALALPVAGLLGAAASAGGEAEGEDTVASPWVLDMTTARAKAKAEGKDLLIYFACDDCLTEEEKDLLEKDLLHHQDFLDGVTKDYVLVRLDVPRTEEARAQVVDLEANEKLEDDYGVEASVTVMLANADGHPYARIGYRADGPKAYVDYLRRERANKTALEALVGADEETVSVEQLKAGFHVMRGERLFRYPAYAWVVDWAREFDADGSLGMKPAIEAREENEAFEALAKNHRGDETEVEELAAFLIQSKYQELSHDGAFIRYILGCVEALIVEPGRPAFSRERREQRARLAKQLAERLAKDDAYATSEEGRKIVDGLLARADATIRVMK